MSKFIFMVNVSPAEASESYVSVLLEADTWDEIVSAPPKYIGDEISILMLKHTLSTAYAMYGYAFDIQRFSPRHLYEALSSKGMNFAVNGDVPSNLID